MTHKLILEVKTFQLSSAKRSWHSGGKPPGGGFHPPPQYHLLLTGCQVLLWNKPIKSR